MKGVILAAGTGTRLKPITMSYSKHLIPVYDKPMIYYPLSILMLADIKDIIIVINKEHLNLYKKILGNGNQFGIKIKYVIQSKPKGITDAIISCKKYLNNKPFTVILGDNIFYGNKLILSLQKSLKSNIGCTIFTYQVDNPSDYGIISYKNSKPFKIVEKPKFTKSNHAITGLYIFDSRAFEYSKNIKYSKRGELEITMLLNEYLKRNKINIKDLGRGTTWLDTGTFENLSNASQFIYIIEKRQGLKISCPEEISFRKGWIKKNELKKIINMYSNNPYSKYLNNILNDENI
tara:strand:- start:158 stop:1030 length:873 start_codon:yes stop_codon:yes gene_type:complete